MIPSNAYAIVIIDSKNGACYECDAVPLDGCNICRPADLELCAAETQGVIRDMTYEADSNQPDDHAVDLAQCVTAYQTWRDNNQDLVDQWPHHAVAVVNLVDGTWICGIIIVVYAPPY